MSALVRLKNEFKEDEKCPNLMRRLICPSECRFLLQKLIPFPMSKVNRFPAFFSLEMALWCGLSACKLGIQDCLKSGCKWNFPVLNPSNGANMIFLIILAGDIDRSQASEINK